jgi:hypothetical protein
LPWSSPFEQFAVVCREDSMGSGHNCSPVKYYLADRRTLFLREDSAGWRASNRTGGH